ncbi:L-asparagine oxygenase [Microdochium nivale]|nr:L-asparagine oxygenase [Microdochium nivale]
MGVERGGEQHEAAIEKILKAAKDAGKQAASFYTFDANNVTSLSRFNSGPHVEIPPLSGAQLYAIKVLEDTCLSQSLQMVLEPGDIQLLVNSHVLHARTAYKDYAPGTVDEKPSKERSRRRFDAALAVNSSDRGRLEFTIS